MRRTCSKIGPLQAAAAAVFVVVVAGCGGKSVDDLAAHRFGDGAGSCRAAASTEIGKVYSCQNGNGGTVCVVRDGDDLLMVSAQQLEQYGISC